jgi:D-arabinose 1-dehydrogenase-like Zn-dependent alcohol dehydrogenase
VSSRPVAQTLIICVSILCAVAVVVSGLTFLQPGTAQSVVIVGSILLAIGMVVGGWQLSASRKATMALTSGEEHRGMADEYRRLADMAITAQEHTDLKLGDVAIQLAQLRGQLESVQRILKDVE